MTEEKPVIFIRHKLASTPEILRNLWENRKIAIHYEDRKSANPEDYSEKVRRGITVALNYFKECTEKGAIVVAVYRKLHRNKLLIGEIEKGTKIEFEEFDFENGKVIFKTMQMRNVQELHYIDYPILGAIQPRQVTITHLRKYADIVRHLFEKKELSESVYSLSPEQLEVLCYEYLRRKEKIDALLLPIGRNLIDVDIIGIDKKGAKISAQVTFADDEARVVEKFERLQESIPEEDKETKLLFFAPKNDTIKEITKKAENIEVIDIVKMFDELKKEQSGKRLIDNMLNKK